MLTPLKNLPYSSTQVPITTKFPAWAPLLFGISSDSNDVQCDWGCRFYLLVPLFTYKICIIGHCDICMYINDYFSTTTKYLLSNSR